MNNILCALGVISVVCTVVACVFIGVDIMHDNKRDE